MSKIIKIIAIIIIGAAVFILACNFMFERILHNMFMPNEKIVESFDKHYMYMQLSSPKETLCTVVIFENFASDKQISFTLPYFNNRTIRTIAWGLKTNDLFVSSSDTGLTIYRIKDEIWVPYYLIVEDNPDGTLAYYLQQGGSIEQRKLRHELPSDTIPNDINDQISKDRQKYGDKVYRPL
jgi:hypothetical protein